jgi:hypothetical protein
MCWGKIFKNCLLYLLDLFASSAKILHFDIDPAEIGKNKIADIVGNVRLKDPSSTLTTNQLKYNLQSKEAIYTTGGKIISNKDKNQFKIYKTISQFCILKNKCLKIILKSSLKNFYKKNLIMLLTNLILLEQSYKLFLMVKIKHFINDIG